MYKKILFLFFVLPVSISAFSQYNYDAGYGVVYNILHTKCSNAGCHSATSAEALKFDADTTLVYNQIFNQTPTNAAAQARGEKLVWIDQPYQSYLLKKAASWFDTDLALPAAETDSAHINAGLTNKEVEYLRQWIMNDAAPTGLTIDTTMINEYYNDTARGPFSPKMPKPAVGTGFQVRYGPIFLRNTPGQGEAEYMLMNQFNFPSDMEITGLNMQMTSFSHHFILFKFNDSASAMAKQVGLRKVILSLASTVSPFDGNKSVCSAWVFPQDIELPTGTAFYWPKTTYLDLDFHVKNYSTYPILPFDVYINVAATPRVVGDNVIEMKSHLNNNTSLGVVDLNPPYHLNILPPHTTSVCIDADGDNGSDNMRYLWMLNSHTHKMGINFNIYKYDPSKNNSLGDTIYKGYYDYNNPGGTLDLGYYDWEHPSVEFFSPQMPVDYHSSGLIAETVYKNDSSFYQRFGFTSADEMQLFYYLYTSQLPGSAGIDGINKAAFDFTVYPNPMAGKGTLAYTLTTSSTVNASITDITGKEIAVLKDEKEQAGKYSIDLGTKTGLSSGMYFARVSVNGETYTKKFVVE
jgi:hypothetical protein